jgi:AraC-like DNA-binding protein
MDRAVRSTVTFASRRPAPWLAPYVERLWALSDVAAHASERIVPSGTFELVVNLDQNEIVVRREGEPVETRYAGAVVSGAYGRSFVIDARAHRSIVGAHFRPGGAAAFLGLPAIELADTHVDLDALWGPDAGRLRDALCSTGSTHARFDVIEAALRARLAPTRDRPVIDAALVALSRSADAVGALVQRSGLSHRRFVDLFGARVGMSPKRFARICRLQRALAYERRGAMGWARIALACGYADQSHLVRDCVEIVGLTPTAYARTRSDALLRNHLPVDASISSKTPRPPRS